MAVRVWRSAASCALVLLMLATAGRRQVAAGAPPAAAATPPAGSAAPTYRTSTELVQVDVIVEDSKGRFVDNLTRKDFEVFEDGKPQKIEAFSLVGAPNGAPSGPAATPSTAGAKALPAAPAAAAPAQRRIFIMVFDDRHMMPGGFNNVKRAARQFINQEFTGSDVGGIVANGEMLGDRLTTDRAQLLSYVKQLKPRASVMTQHYFLQEWPQLLSTEEAEQIVAGNQAVLNEAVVRAAQSTTGGRYAMDPTGAVMEKAQQVVTRAQVQTNETLNTLAVLMAGLAKFPGPKTVVFFSDGFFSEESWPGVEQVVGLAARADVRIYSVDARGLNLTSTNDTSLNPTTTVQGLGSIFANEDTGTDGPNSLAVDTGGFVTRYTNDFLKALDQIAADGRTYYLIGYRPTNTDFNGKFRKIAVKVTRRGLKVRARRGYLALPPSAVPTVTKLATSAAPPAAPAPATGPALMPDGPQHVEQLQQAVSRAAGSAAAAPTPALSGDTRKAWTAYQHGDLDAAAAGFQKALAQPDAQPWVHYAYGLTQYGLSHVDGAIDQWNEVRKVSPGFEPVYFDLAHAYLRTGNPQAALKILKAAARRWANDVQVYNAMGVIQVRLGVLDDAVQSFERATKAAPKDGVSYFNLGKVLELRYVRSRRYVSGTGGFTSNDRDRRAAIDAFKRYLKIGGPFASAAQQDLTRLEGQATDKGLR